MQKGVGINSIPNRFALLCGTITTFIVFMAYIYTPIVDGFNLTTINFMIGLVLIPTTITYLAAKKLSQQIIQLKKSADSIAQGNFDHPIDVEGACDVGSLADSFAG